MTYESIKIEEFRNLLGVWEVVGFGRVRQSTVGALETEIEVFLAEPDIRRGGVFAPDGAVVSRWIGCGFLDVVTVGSRWHTGYFDGAAYVLPDERRVAFLTVATVGECQVSKETPFFPTAAFKDAPCYVVRLDGSPKAIAVVPVMEVLRATFGETSGFLRQLFDGVRNEEGVSDRPLFDWDRSRRRQSDGVVQLVAKTRVSDAEARLGAAVVTDKCLRITHNAVFKGLQDSLEWRNELPLFVRAPFPFANALKWTFEGRWIGLPDPSKTGGIARRLLITKIRKIEYRPDFKNVEVQQPSKKRGVKKSSRRCGPTRIGTASKIIIRRGPPPGTGRAPVVAKVRNASMIRPDAVNISRKPIELEAVPADPPSIAVRQFEMFGSTADRQRNGDANIAHLATVRDETYRYDMYMEAMERTLGAVRALAEARGWVLSDRAGKGSPGFEPIGARPKFWMLTAYLRTDSGWILVADAGSVMGNQRSLGLIARRDSGRHTDSDWDEVKKFALRSKGHWGGTQAPRPGGLAIIARDRPFEVWSNERLYADLIGDWVDSAFGPLQLVHCATAAP